jgi:hypothetical protein
MGQTCWRHHKPPYSRFHQYGIVTNYGLQVTISLMAHLSSFCPIQRDKTHPAPNDFALYLGFAGIIAILLVIPDQTFSLAVAIVLSLLLYSF